jgi:iron complex transport system ATP-binding protein
MLEANNISVNLGGKEILSDISMAAAEGQLTAIIGPNGSGKTTLIRALTGEIPFNGDAHLNGLDLSTTTSLKLASMRGVLPQSASLSFPFTVFEVVRLGLTLGVQANIDVPTRISEALTKVGLAGFGKRYYQELSGGEQQRVQLARVLAQVWEPTFQKKPRCLFLDEPISSLDIKHQIQIMNIARDYAKSGGGVVAILHDLNLTAHYADHVVLINKGRVHAQGTPKTVLTAEHLELVYGCPMSVGQVPAGMNFFVLPEISHAARI